MNRTYFIFSITFILLFASCNLQRSSSKLKYPEAHINPGIKISANEKYIWYICSFENKKSGIYKISLENDSVYEVVPPQAMFIRSFAFDGSEKNIYFISSYQFPNKKTKYAIYQYQSQSDFLDTLKTFDRRLSRLHFGSDRQLLLFATMFIKEEKISNSYTNYVRSMIVSSIDTKGTDYKIYQKTENREVYISDVSGNDVYFSSSDYRSKEGPLKYNIVDDLITDLTPENVSELSNQGTNNFIVGLLSPYPGNTDKEYFFRSATTLYQANYPSKKARFFYEMSLPERENFHLLSFKILKNTKQYLVVREVGPITTAFFILDEKGNILRVVQPDMTKFEQANKFSKRPLDYFEK